MGYLIRVKLNKPITENQMDSFLSELPENFQDAWGLGIKFSKQKWGWPLAVDVSLPKHCSNEVWLSGSYSMSGRIALSFKAALGKVLNKHGFRYKASKME